MSMQWTILAIIAEQPRFGLEIKQVFDERTGSMWPLNVGQVYGTLARLEELGHVELIDPPGPDGQKTYSITEAGRAQLDEWFASPAPRKAPLREETVLKILMAHANPSRDTESIFAVERAAVLKRLQDLTRLKQRDPGTHDLGWQCLLDSLIFQAEARSRWLDACEVRLGVGSAKATSPTTNQTSARAAHDADVTERTIS